MPKVPLNVTRSPTGTSRHRLGLDALKIAPALRDSELRARFKRVSQALTKNGKKPSVSFARRFYQNYRATLVRLDGGGEEFAASLISYWLDGVDLPSILKELSLYLLEVNYTEQIKVVASLLTALRKFADASDRSISASQVDEIEAVLQKSFNEPLHILLARSRKEGNPAAPPKKQFPNWNPETTGLTAKQHWEKYFAGLELEARPTQGQLLESDLRFAKALREHARGSDKTLDDFLLKGDRRRRGRKIKPPLSPEEAVAQLQQDREKRRAAAAKRRAKPIRRPRKSPTSGSGTPSP